MKKTQVIKVEEVALEGKVIEKNTHKKTLAKVILKNAPNLLGAVPFVGGTIAAVSQTAIGATVDYWDEIAAQKREKEWESFVDKLDHRLSVLEIKSEAKDYFENTVIFRFEDIKRKLFTEPEKGFDELLAEFVAFALSDLNTPPNAKDLILSSLLSIDKVDLTVLKQLDTQFRFNLNGGNALGVDFDTLSTLLKPGGIDNIMISRSIQRLESEDLIAPLTRNNAVLSERPTLEGLMEGEKSPQYYSQGGFVITAFGRRFLRFLRLSD